VKVVAGLAFVSGTGSRRPDDSIAGAEVVDGTKVLDVAIQTRAVMRNIADILSVVGASLADLVQVTCYLVDMADFATYNTGVSGALRCRDRPHPDHRRRPRTTPPRPADRIQAIAAMPAS
jgi:2-aminomuconate deaminase